MLKDDSCDLNKMIGQVIESINIGLKYPEFVELYDECVRILILIAKVQYLLDAHSRMIEDG